GRRLGPGRLERRLRLCPGRPGPGAGRTRARSSALRVMTRPVVVKVGGSLLDWPELPARLAADLAGRRERPLVLVGGGGRLVAVLRDLDRRHALGEELAHVLALRALDVTAHALAALLPGLEVGEGLNTLRAIWAAGRTPVLAPRPFLEEDDRRSPDPLPHSW